MGVKMVMTKPGGGKASGSFLTPEGRRFSEDYGRLTNRIIQQADREFNKIFGNPKDR
jgi:molybdenum-dependent DNA-binding transcriptional regulator ModE